MNTGYTTLTRLNQDRTLNLRSKVEKIRKRAEQLAEPERTLVRMFLDNANSFRQISQLLGISEASVSRRVKKIIGRLSDPSIDGVLNKGDKLGRRQRKIARDFFLRGMTVKKIAHKYGMTYYNTRRIINLLRKLSTQRKNKTTIRYY
jgi:DNA-directed RNA polymerase specialized sigma subunit